jgi:hypothetical protein
MLTKHQLLSKLREPRSKRWIEGLSLKLMLEGFYLSDLLELTIHTDSQTAFLAAWLLDTVVTNNITGYAQKLDDFIRYSGLIKQHSCFRHYARIFMHFTLADTDAKVKQKLAETDMEPIVEQCFDWLIDPEIKVAVKALAAQILFNLHHRYDWIAEELQNQLLFLIKNGSPGIQTTGRRLLNALTTD